MTLFERLQDMQDLKLKPRILCTLLKDYVPDEKRPFANPSGLSQLVSTIQLHKLLSETSTKSEQQNQIETWKSVVDDWINQVLELISSKTPDKCWAGICLLGLTCQECSSDRFLASYSSWFQKLLPYIQQPPESQILRVASCSAASDLLSRLAKFPNAKKDAHSLAGKMVQPMIKLLEGDDSEAVWEASLHLLQTILLTVPTALNNYQDKIEAAIVQKIFSAKPTEKIIKKLSHCLALLPRVNGNGDSWLMMMQRLLLSINTHLDSIFLGLEEEGKGREALKVLIPPGNDPPPGLGGAAGSVDDIWKSESLVVARLCALVSSCCMMLMSSYNVQVKVPVRPLLGLVERILMIDGSLSNKMLSFVTTIHQELICAELPILHSYSLELLVATIKSIRSQLLPHAAAVVRLITRYFRKCPSPKLRIKVYLVAKILLTSMGVGMAMHLAQDVVANACADLEEAHKSCEKSRVSNGATLGAWSKKRKHASVSECETSTCGGSGAGVSHGQLDSPISLKIAALEALETLLTVGGAFKSENWRMRVDNVIMMTASNACNEGWNGGEENLLLPGETYLNLEGLQLAAFRALLASLLSPTRLRPVFLAQGLELFCRGKRETGTSLASFCVHALLCLEVLIHPRALPIDDFPPSMPKQSDHTTRGFAVAPILGDIGRSNGLESCIDDDDDDLYKKWLGKSSMVDSPENHPCAMEIEGPPEGRRVRVEDKPSGVPKAAADNETTENKKDDDIVEIPTSVQDTAAYEERDLVTRDVETESKMATERDPGKAEIGCEESDFVARDVETEMKMATSRDSGKADGASRPIDAEIDSKTVENLSQADGAASNANANTVDSDDSSMSPCPEITFFSESESSSDSD